MKNLTENEMKVMQTIDRSCYGEYLRDAIWFFEISDDSGLKSTSIPGVVSSLVKKGYVATSDCWAGDKCDFDTATIEMTEAGAKAYIDQNGGSEKTYEPA